MANYSDSGPFWWRTDCSAKMNSIKEDRYWEISRTCGVSLLTFPEFFLVGGSLLVLCLYLDLCHKIIHINGYYVNWPVWVVSALSLTTPQ